MTGSGTNRADTVNAVPAFGQVRPTMLFAVPHFPLGEYFSYISNTNIVSEKYSCVLSSLTSAVRYSP